MISDFMLREITHRDEEYSIRAVRSRTSAGLSAIKVVVPARGEFPEQSLLFSSEVYGADYEAVAKRTIEILDKVISDPCNLPPMPTAVS